MRVVRSIPALNGAALEAVRQWRFKPAATGGKPVAAWVSVPISFRK
jgi:protein TonB